MCSLLRPRLPCGENPHERGHPVPPPLLPLHLVQAAATPLHLLPGRADRTALLQAPLLAACCARRVGADG
eukprot:scaffold119138_cov31-Tisochrysis_lutea.AAC.10